MRASHAAAALGTVFFPLVLLCGTGAGSERKATTLTFLDAALSVPDVQFKPDPELEEFTRQTGIAVKHIPGPEGSLNQLALFRQSLASGAPAPDVYGIDVVWPEILSEQLVDLRPLLASELAREDPAAVAGYTVAGKAVAIPYRPQVGVLVYRRDLLRRYGYRAPPRTWDELETMAARIQAGERAKGARDFWGYVWQGAATEGLACNALEWQAAEGGGTIIEADQTVSIDNPHAVRAWQRAARWVGTISPPSVVAYREWDSVNVWSAGNAAFLRTWESGYLSRRRAAAPGGELIAGLPSGDKVGVTSMPGGPAGRAGTLGGFGLAISRSSAHPREALALIQFLVRREREQARAAQSESTGREKHDLPAILEPHSSARSGRRMGGVVVRPSTAAGHRYEDVVRAYYLAVHSVLTGKRSAPDAARGLEQELVRMTGFRRAPPPAPAAR